ncbi:MAG: multiprotein bridging factor aMBF1 [Candidatus Micrarchaeota archaeon]
MAQECHICGKPAVSEALVEGARVYLCDSCIRYGKPIQKPIQSRTHNATPYPPTMPAAHQRQAFTPKEYGAVENYGEKIRNSREAMHLTRKELANTLFINENVIERLEDELLKPEHKVAEKLEKFLKIKIIEEEGAGEDPEKLRKELDAMHKAGKAAGGVTFGDVVDIKMRQKK